MSERERLNKILGTYDQRISDLEFLVKRMHTVLTGLAKGIVDEKGRNSKSIEIPSLRSKGTTDENNN